MRARPGSPAVGTWIRAAKRLALYMRDGWRCAYCGADLRDDLTSATLDHLTPRSRGGSNEHTNLITACATCNSRRRDRRLDVALAARPLARRAALCLVDDRGQADLIRQHARDRARLMRVHARQSIEPWMRKAKEFLRHFGFGPL